MPTDTVKVSINDLNTAIRAFNALAECEAVALSKDSIINADMAEIKAYEQQTAKGAAAMADMQAITVLLQQQNSLLQFDNRALKKRNRNQTIKAIVLPVAVGVITGAAGVAVGRFVRW